MNPKSIADLLGYIAAAIGIVMFVPKPTDIGKRKILKQHLLQPILFLPQDHFCGQFME